MNIYNSRGTRLNEGKVKKPVLKMRMRRRKDLRLRGESRQDSRGVSPTHVTWVAAVTNFRDLEKVSDFHGRSHVP